MLSMLEIATELQTERETAFPKVPETAYITPIVEYLQSNVAVDLLLNYRELANAKIELQIEEEQRIRVALDGYQVDHWEHSIEDIYDASGTVRFRVKKGKPRIGLKIPLPSRNTFRTKCCMRIEIRPADEDQEAIFFAFRDIMLAESGLQKVQKFGTRVQLTDGHEVWMNKNDKDEYWIEEDGRDYEIELFLPEGITYLGHIRSYINLPELGKQQLADFENTFYQNTLDTSRTAKGEKDTSVSTLKEGTTLSAQELQEQVRQNVHRTSEHIWNNRLEPITTPETLRELLKEIALEVNTNIDDGLKLRDWEVKYGRKVLPGEPLKLEMATFYDEMFTKMRLAEKAKIDPYEMAAWIEWKLDADLHPFADGCGRIAKAWSAFFLVRLEKPLPRYSSRKAYYDALNAGRDSFYAYYAKITK
ncbi:MAG: Fic family protein [Candidatus Woesebacteria bacterium]